MHPLHRPADLLQHRADVLRADECRRGPLERLAAPAPELWVASHRVLELRAVRLDGVPRPGGRADGPAEQHVIREDEVGREQGPDGGRVLVDPGVELVARAVLDATHLVALVAVEDEDREEPMNVRAEHGRAAEVVRLGAGLLAEHRHVVPCATPLAGELARVDVRARPAEEVSVPEQDAHLRHPARPPGSRRGHPLRGVRAGMSVRAGRRNVAAAREGPTAHGSRTLGSPARPGPSGDPVVPICSSVAVIVGSQSLPSSAPLQQPSGASWSKLQGRPRLCRPGPSSPGRSPA